MNHFLVCPSPFFPPCLNCCRTQTWTNAQRRAATFASKLVSTQPEVINVPVTTASNSRTTGDLANVYIMFPKIYIRLSIAGLGRATSSHVDNYFLVRLELVPELQTLLINYESMSKRLAALEQVKQKAPPSTNCTHFSIHFHSRFSPVFRLLRWQEPRVNSSPSQPHPAPQVDVIDYQSTIANMTDHIILLEEKLNKLVT